MNCLRCGKELVGKQTKWCSVNCQSKKWLDEHPQVRRDILNNWRKNNPDKSKLLQHRHRKRQMLNNPDKYNARRFGYLHRDSKCNNCGETSNLEFHHTNYKKQEGITLCRDCHRSLYGGMIA